MPLSSGLPKIIIKEWAKIPKILLANIEKEKQNLTIRNKTKFSSMQKGFSCTGPDFFSLWKEDEFNLYVPRAYRPNLSPGLLKNKDFLVEYEVINSTTRNNCIKDNIILGPNEKQPFDQQPAFDALISGPSWPFGKQLAVRCGGGKSLVALKAACHRAGRTLWITMNTSLLEQAKRDITKWLGLRTEQIGHIQSNIEKWQGYEIAVAMLHSLALKEYSQEFYNYWDLIIFDEGDVLGAEHFSDVVHRFRGERWLLTATPKRPDGMEVLYNLHIGSVCYQNLEYDLQPECYFVPTKAGPKNIVKVGWDPKRREKRVSLALTAQRLLFDLERRNILFDLINNSLNENRTCLVLGDSIEALADMARDARIKLANATHGLVIGRIPQKDRADIINKNQVVWASTKIAYRGLDRPSFDTLFISSLISANEATWKQAVGRILRYIPGKIPKVYVLEDRYLGPPFTTLINKLASLFKRQGWSVSNVTT